MQQLQKSIELEESLERQLKSLLNTQQCMLKREGRLLKESDSASSLLPTFNEQQLTAFFNDLNLIPDFKFNIPALIPDS